MPRATTQCVHAGPTRSEIAALLMDRLVPEAKQQGVRKQISAEIPAPLVLEKYGVRIMLTGNILLMPEDRALSALLDIFDPEQGKVFSARWVPRQPWISPTLVCLERGPWVPGILGDL